MRKSILMVLTLALLAGIASAKLGDLVASFDNHPVGGTANHYGLAADRNYLYSYYYTTGYLIYRMLRSNGSLVSSYRCPYVGSPNYYCRGMSYGGGTILYINNYSTRRVGRFYASTGSLIRTWSWPSGLRYGICCNHDGTNYGTRIWQSYGNLGTFYQSTTTGSFISSFDIAVTYQYDDAWDYGNNMIWYGNYSTDYIYGVKTNGSILASWRGPTAVSNPYGVAYYGQRLYVSTSAGTPDEYIWVYDCPNTVGVTPASVGKVKALFK